MQYVYLVYSLDYDTYSYSGTSPTLELATLSEETAKAKVAELFAKLSPQCQKDLKPYSDKMALS